MLCMYTGRITRLLYIVCLLLHYIGIGCRTDKNLKRTKATGLNPSHFSRNFVCKEDFHPEGD